MVPMDESIELDSNFMPPLIDDDEIVQPLSEPEPVVQIGQIYENMASDDEEIQEEDLLGYVDHPPNQVQGHN